MLEIKSTWHKVTREDVVQMFWDLVQLAKEKCLFSYLTKDYWCRGLYYSTRKSRNIGVCYTSHDSMAWCVVINDKLLQCSTDKIRQILVHEIAHACVPKDHHGWLWQQTADTLGRQWGYDATRLCSDREITDVCCTSKERKYIVECPVCGVQWKYKVKCHTVKYPMLYHHTKCGANLVRIDNL